MNRIRHTGNEGYPQIVSVRGNVRDGIINW